MSLQLVIVAGPDAGKALTLQRGADLMLGRAQNSFYRLNDPRASRAHCQILLQGDVATVICNGGSVACSSRSSSALLPGIGAEAIAVPLRLSIGMTC